MEMEYRKLKLTIVSADNLPNVLRMGKMRVYAVVSCNGASFTTKVCNDVDNGKNPRWREAFDFWIEETSVQKRGTNVVVKLYCKRKWGRRGKPVGDEVAIEVCSLYQRGLRDENTVTYSVPNARGGTLNILYDFGPVLAPKQRCSTWNKIFGCGFNLCCAAMPNFI